jgi:hypothetical protein
MTEAVNSLPLENPEQAKSAAGGAVAFPSEPFACPECGQMLAPNVRVCVACKAPIDPARIQRPRVAQAVVVAAAPASKPLPSVRFPWPIFFTVFVASLLLFGALMQMLTLEHAQMVMAGLEILVGLWVIRDAIARKIPSPFRWGLAAMLIHVVFLSWYIGRRRTPELPCPFVEAKASPLSRYLLLALMVFFLLSAVMYFLQGPAPK